ncbi:hypothetical protein BDP27DRAFT_1421080 [Rhodocollybia butyracea]|uniref:Uncharacterized protein n=1 Tax=Rhodocollybia butyracea TaxID=206335 RepID=A0A9P5PWE2_9AGAR|nr:hypothetical protein BDP27DRAFT_1421080 [Rhodocollybia butyracea]
MRTTAFPSLLLYAILAITTFDCGLAVPVRGGSPPRYAEAAGDPPPTYNPPSFHDASLYNEPISIQFTTANDVKTRKLEKNNNMPVKSRTPGIFLHFGRVHAENTAKGHGEEVCDGTHTIHGVGQAANEHFDLGGVYNYLSVICFPHGHKANMAQVEHLIAAGAPSGVSAFVWVPALNGLETGVAVSSSHTSNPTVLLSLPKLYGA